VPLFDRDLVNADHARRRRSRHPQLFAHVQLVQLLDPVPIQAHMPGDILDGHRAAERAGLQHEPVRVVGIRGQKVEPLPLHAATPPAIDAAIFEVQIHLMIAAIEVACAVPSPIIEAGVWRAAQAAHRFF
jgi:hypothetical protein